LLCIATAFRAMTVTPMPAGYDIVLLADVAARQSRAGRPQRVIGSEDAVIPAPVFPRLWNEIREPVECEAVLSDPRQHARLHPVLRAAAPRQLGDQLRRELHRVEVTPTPLLRVIVQAKRLPAFRADNARADVYQADFDLPLVESRCNSIDSPGVVKAHKSGVVGGKCVYPCNLRHSRLENDRPEPRYSPKNPSRKFIGKPFHTF